MLTVNTMLKTWLLCLNNENFLLFWHRSPIILSVHHKVPIMRALLMVRLHPHQNCPKVELLLAIWKMDRGNLSVEELTMPLELIFFVKELKPVICSVQPLMAGVSHQWVAVYSKHNSLLDIKLGSIFPNFYPPLASL